MTIEQLLGQSVEDWEKMSQQQLEDLLKPYFQVTRPSITGSVIKQNIVKSKMSMGFEAKKLIAQIEALVKGKT